MIDLLREQAEVVGRRGRPFEDAPRLRVPALTGEALHEPERAGQERALAAGEPVASLSVVADRPPTTGALVLDEDTDSRLAERGVLRREGRSWVVSGAPPGA